MVGSRVEAGSKKQPGAICKQVNRAARGGRRPNCPQKLGEGWLSSGAETEAQKCQGGDVKKKVVAGETAGKWGAGVRKRGTAGLFRAIDAGIRSGYSGWRGCFCWCWLVLVLVLVSAPVEQNRGIERIRFDLI